MKTKKQKSLVTIFVSLSFCLACEFEKHLESNLEIDTFKIEVLSDTVPSEVHVITKIISVGYVKLEYTHEGAFASLESINPCNQHILIINSTKEAISNDTSILFYKAAGTYKIILNTNDKKYEDTFELFE